MPMMSKSVLWAGIDHRNSSNKKFRTETFCYGPKSCPFYKAGHTRKVPGRKGMTWEEEDWVDEEATAHRGMDESAVFDRRFALMADAPAHADLLS